MILLVKSKSSLQIWSPPGVWPLCCLKSKKWPTNSITSTRNWLDLISTWDLTFSWVTSDHHKFLINCSSFLDANQVYYLFKNAINLIYFRGLVKTGLWPLAHGEYVECLDYARAKDWVKSRSSSFLNVAPTKIVFILGTLNRLTKFDSSQIG